MAWALPIKETNVRIQCVDEKDVNDKLADIIYDIASIINVETKLEILPMAL